MAFTKTLNKIKDSLFSEIHSNNLIYNTCWEDPAIDRKLLDIKADSEIVMITSAGCNALDYLLDNPKAVHCVDMNLRQNALLELKLALIEQTDYETLYEFFGLGRHENASVIYQNKLRPALSRDGALFWDEKIVYFLSSTKKNTFYFKGTAGRFAWMFKKYLNTKPKTQKLVNELLEANTLEEQTAIYEKLEPRLLNKLIKWLMSRHLTLSLLGVPRAQRQLILDEYPGGMPDFIAANLRHIFTKIPIKTNYFWYLYIKGHYEKDNAPNYLLPQHFETLKEHSNNVDWHTGTVSEFLRLHPKKYSHFVLLDHQDWLAHHDVDALVEEWKYILKNSAPGTKILLRSAAKKIDFLPKFVIDSCTLDTEQCATLHQNDRVGTYGSTHLLTVK